MEVLAAIKNKKSQILGIFRELGKDDAHLQCTLYGHYQVPVGSPCARLLLRSTDYSVLPHSLKSFGSVRGTD